MKVVIFFMNFKKYCQKILTLKSTIFSSGIKFSKSDNNIKLDGENSSSEVYSGLFLGKNNQEIKTSVKHLKPNCQSHQDIKNVLTTRSKGVFQGKDFCR